MSIFNTWIFLVFSIALINAIQLDGTCTDNNQCDGNSNGTMNCVSGKCQCITPWYKPCKTACEINYRFAYQGDACRIPDNCIGNTDCRNGKCECLESFTAKEGVCFKNLNSVCKNDSECWSNYCYNSKCSCPSGYQVIDNGTNCEKKFVDIYDSWEKANESNAFCLNQNSCIDILAECYTDPAHNTTKFCKCPEGYSNKANKSCEAIKGELLSPLDVIPSSYGQCGYCEDDNAACITVLDKRTCWCRAGYTKDGNTCKKQSTKSAIIFPNSQDVNLNDFTNGCTNENKTKLCSCGPHYKFLSKDLPCQKIEPKWINDTYEYGLCTQINSRDEFIREEGICAEGLKCEARINKHICTCGIDKFLDLNNLTKCVYFIGKAANTDDECPTNTVRNITTKICQCPDGYKPIDNNRQCELTLSSETSNTSCNRDPSKDVVCRSFGQKAFFCNLGQCRCSGEESFPADDKTQCYARVNVPLTGTIESCPLNSSLESNRCKCNAGYHPSDNLHQCVRWAAKLLENTGSPPFTSADLTTSDCQNLFKGPVEGYNNDTCQCISDAFVNDDNTGCWYKLETPITGTIKPLFCPPNSTIGGQPICLCKRGYTRNVNRCNQLTEQVYIDNDPAARNITGITTNVCKTFFGTASEKSNNRDYCICHPDAYPVLSNTYCQFIINKWNTEIKDDQTCPSNSFVESAGPENSTCKCITGFHPSPNYQTCELANISLTGVTDRGTSNTTNCINFNNDDCTAKYGEHAFCKDETCYCNRRLSYKNKDGKCESFSNYIFPGEHELSVYACDTTEDCGNNTSVICDFSNNNLGYQVCRCQDGFLLDPKSQTCVNDRCLNCNTNDNFECRDYQCQCKPTYYLENSKCVKNTIKLQLYQQCNLTLFQQTIANDSLVCDRFCERAQCNVGHRPEGQTDCVRYRLENDRCLYREDICNTIDKNSGCDRDKNQCLCHPSYYRADETCKKGLGSECFDDVECGKGMECKGKRCNCNEGLLVQETTNSYGRPVQFCRNGIDKIRFDPIFLLISIILYIIKTQN